MVSRIRFIFLVSSGFLLAACGRQVVVTPDADSAAGQAAQAEQPYVKPPPPQPARLQAWGPWRRGRVVAKEHDPNPPFLSSAGRHFLLTIVVAETPKSTADHEGVFKSLQGIAQADFIEPGRYLTLPHCEFGDADGVEVGDVFFFRTSIEGQFGKAPIWRGPVETVRGIPADLLQGE